MIDVVNWQRELPTFEESTARARENRRFSRVCGFHTRTNKLKYIPHSNAPLAPTSLVSVRVWAGRREGLPSHTLTDTRRIFRQFHLTSAQNIFQFVLLVYQFYITS